MRRSKQRIPDEESKKILTKSTNGILSLIDPNVKPYGVPMSFIYDGENSIYFHCAFCGRKIECIKNNPRACFTIVDQDEIHPDEFTTYFRSVVVEGTISIIEDREQMIESLRLLSSKYSPGIDCEPEIEKGIDHVLIMKLKIDTITGKEAIELIKQRIQD